jgi:hypothetical protein
VDKRAPFGCFSMQRGVIVIGQRPVFDDAAKGVPPRRSRCAMKISEILVNGRSVSREYRASGMSIAK